MEDKRKYIIRLVATVAPIACIVFILLLLSLTSPSAAGPPGILAFFLLLYLLVASSIYALIRGVSYLGLAVFKKSITTKQTIYASLVAALGPILLVALNTLGGIGLVELLLVILLVVLGCFYVIRRVATD